MASNLLGRCVCPLCDDQKAHVKIKTDKPEGASAYPYLHCRECGFQGHTKNRQQAELLLKKTRAENLGPSVVVNPEKPNPGPVEIVPEPKTEKPAGGFLFDIFKDRQ